MSAGSAEIESGQKEAYNGKANLIPVQPGEVRNPSGKNQYTYKRNFEQSIDNLLRGDVTPDYVELVPANIRELVQARIDGGAKLTRGEVIALITVAGAFQGDEKQLPEVLKRLWPVTEKHEVSTPNGPLELSAGAPPLDMSVYTPEERADLQRLIHKQLQAKATDDG